MVDDRITDGKRTAQLLASELTGRTDGPLGRLTVVDAERDAEPSPDGPVAYGIAVDGERVADVRLFSDSIEIRVADLDPEALTDALAGPGVRARVEDGAAIVAIDYGAAVKRAVDALAAAVEE